MASRTQNVRRILVFSIIKYAAQLLLQFILRTALIYIMGAQYLGLNGLFSNIFAFLNLAELGIGSAIIYSMYKPVADNDIEKIRALQQLYKKFYLIIASFVLVVGFVLTPFLKFFIKDATTVPINIYLLFIMYLVNSVVGYLSAHKRAVLLAYQRNDIENKIITICMFAMTITQIGALLLFKNYYIFYSVNIAFTIIECVLIQVVTNKKFPELKVKTSVELDKDTKNGISKNVFALTAHKIGGAVVGATDNILISAMFGSVLVGIYANYALIISSLTLLIGLLNTTLVGSVGNLISSKPKEYVYENYKQINFIFSFLAAFCTICLFVLIQPFIACWTGRSGENWMLSNSTVILLCLSFYLNQMRAGVQIFKNCNGLFWQDRWKPIVESVVNLASSILLARWIGINGIFLGTIISTLIAPFWVEPHVLYKHYFKRSVATYFIKYAYDTLVMVGVGAACYFVCNLIPVGGIALLIARFAVCGILAAVLLVVAHCWTKEFKQTFKSVLQFLKLKK